MQWVAAGYELENCFFRQQSAATHFSHDLKIDELRVDIAVLRKILAGFDRARTAGTSVLHAAWC